MFHGEQRRQGPQAGWRPELSFAGEWRGHKGRNLVGGGGEASELEGWDKGDKRQRDRKREPAFSSEEGTLH